MLSLVLQDVAQRWSDPQERGSPLSHVAGMAPPHGAPSLVYSVLALNFIVFSFNSSTEYRKHMLGLQRVESQDTSKDLTPLSGADRVGISE